MKKHMLKERAKKDTMTPLKRPGSTQHRLSFMMLWDERSGQMESP